MSLLKFDYATQLKNKPVVPLMVTDKPYYAKGDGLTDDTAAIAAAIADAEDRTLYFPPGTYLISPQEFVGFRVLNNTVIEFDPQAKLLVSTTSGNAGQYSRVFECMEVNGCQNVTFLNMTIDHQSSLNPYPSGGSYIQTHRRNTIWWEGIENGTVIIENLWVQNSISGNDVLINHTVTGTRAGYVRVHNCRFTGMGGGAFTWDSSVIYGFAHTANITNNKVEASDYGLNQAYTPVEFYAINLVVSHNNFAKYRTGVIYGAHNAVIANNDILSTVEGIVLANLINVSGDAGTSTYGGLITGNKIRIRNLLITLTSTQRPFGIGCYALVDASVTSVENWLILNNSIEFDPDPNPAPFVDPNAMGIGIYTIFPLFQFNNVKIANNIVINAPWSAIGAGINPITNWSVEDNTVINCGHCASAGFTQNRIPVRFDVPSSNGLKISGNQIIDDSSPLLFQYAFLGRSTTFINTTIGANQVVLRGADTSAYIGKYSFPNVVTIRDTVGVDGSAFNFTDPVLTATSVAVNIPVGGMYCQNGNGTFTKPVVSGTQLLVNPTFTGGTGWVAGAGWTFGSGSGVATNASNTTLNQSGVIAQFKSYQVQFTVSSWVATPSAVMLSAFNGTQILGYVIGNGTYTYIVTSNLAGSTFGFGASPTPINCVITNATIYEVVPTEGVIVGDSVSTLSGKLKLNGAIIATGTQLVAGTGVSGQKGGANCGEFLTSVTGTTTATITPGVASPNGWVVVAFNLTHPANPMLQTVRTTTFATIAGTTVANDVIIWQCIGY